MDLYIEKNKYLSERCQEISPREFYRELFPEGSFEEKGNQSQCRPNGIAVDLSDTERPRRYIVTDDLNVFDDLKGTRFAITSPVSYFGKNRNGRNARYLHALTFDVDGVGMDNLRDIFFQMKNGVIPTATFICNSGHGVHLYYLFEEPIPLYPQNQEYLREVKYALTRRIWNAYTSSIEAPQMQGILQGFRVVGSLTKHGAEYPVRAFEIDRELRYTVEELLSYVPDIYQDKINLLKKKKLSLEEAKKKYPEWYERRIVNGEKGGGKWSLNRAVYDYWKDRIAKEITVGHRYFAIMTLAIYAKKCSQYDAKKNPNPVTEEELRRDAWALLNPFEELTELDTNHFTEHDVVAALELYNEDYITFPKQDISRLTALRIEPQIRRNGQRRADHLEEARAIRDIRQRRQGRVWQNKEGRPKGSGTAEQTVKAWRAEHPEGKKSECHKSTGLDPKTIRKWWGE